MQTKKTIIMNTIKVKVKNEINEIYAAGPVKTAGRFLQLIKAVNDLKEINLMHYPYQNYFGCDLTYETNNGDFGQITCLINYDKLSNELEELIKETKNNLL